MITIRTAPETTAETGPSRKTFEFGEEKRSRGPVLAIGFLAALIAYLRSMTPTATVAEAGPLKADDEAPADVTADRSQPETVDEGKPPRLGSSRGSETSQGQSFVAPDIVRSALLVDDEPFDYARMDARSADLEQPAALLPRPANDNPGAGGGVRPSGAGGGAGVGGANTSLLRRGGVSAGPVERSGEAEPIRPLGETLATEPRGNRAPRVQTPVQLPDTVACRPTTIGLALLLAGASDPDGDVLSIINPRASSGTIERTADGFVYTPVEEWTGRVVLAYEISDGKTSVAQVARFDVAPRSPIIGTEGDDVLAGTACPDTIDARGGDDDIVAGSGGDLVYGRSGDDVIDGGDGDDMIDAGSGNDIIFGGAGDDVIYGRAGNDIIFGGAGNDRIDAGDGDDVIDAGEGNDTVVAGAGHDVVLGGDGNDSLLGGDGRDVLDGGVGDDALDGGTGHDIVDGGVGDDKIAGGTGDDVLIDGTGADVVTGGSGSDVVLASADNNDDVFNGDEGFDVLNYDASTAPVRIDLANGVADGAEIGADRFASFEKFVGSSSDDELIAGDASTILHGGDGDDVISDGAGVLVADGGAGDDVVLVVADQAADTFSGGKGSDTLNFASSEEPVFVDGAEGIATVGTAVADRFSEFEEIIGGSGDDTIVAGGVLQVMTGGDGDDTFMFNERTTESTREIASRVYEILDLEVGDCIRIKELEIRSSDTDSPRVGQDDDGSGDAFNDTYAEIDRRPFRFRSETRDDGEHTWIDVMAEDQDGDQPDPVVVYTIDVYGNHHLYTIEVA
ncbi:MAG: cadherin-like domain-containing protein [Xanthobacteraceae bacterium]